ncbi:MAG: TraR/DksA family transcriptional regulator [Candidatus Kapaibacteriota bacterium]|jgi:RNA polymerase-binding transcription factor DksA
MAKKKEIVEVENVEVQDVDVVLDTDIDSKDKKRGRPKKDVVEVETTAEIVAVEEEIEIDPNLRYPDEDLEEFKAVILENKAETLDELQMLKDRLDDLTNFDFAEESMIYSMHMAEQGSEAAEKEKTYAQIQRINEYLMKLEEALVRIQNKSYGICKSCNIRIAKERLLAVPVTTLSASYKIHKVCPEDGVDRIERRK